MHSKPWANSGSSCVSFLIQLCACNIEILRGIKRGRLFGDVRQAIRAGLYSLRTEDAYVRWIRRFVQFSGGQHPAALTDRDVERFLTARAVQDRVSASTQNQAQALCWFSATK